MTYQDEQRLIRAKIRKQGMVLAVIGVASFLLMPIMNTLWMVIPFMCGMAGSQVTQGEVNRINRRIIRANGSDREEYF